MNERCIMHEDDVVEICKQCKTCKHRRKEYSTAYQKIVCEKFNDKPSYIVRNTKQCDSYEEEA